MKSSLQPVSPRNLRWLYVVIPNERLVSVITYKNKSISEASPDLESWRGLCQCAYIGSPRGKDAQHKGRHSRRCCYLNRSEKYKMILGKHRPSYLFFGGSCAPGSRHVPLLFSDPHTVSPCALVLHCMQLPTGRSGTRFNSAQISVRCIYMPAIDGSLVFLPSTEPATWLRLLHPWC